MIFNQLTIAKMDNFSLLQIIEKIPELRFIYMRSYPSDKLPRLTKYPFGIVNSAPSKNGEEHWIMIVQLDKTYYLADSLGRKRTTYSFLTKSIGKWLPENYKKLIICVVITQFIQHFFFLNCTRET